MWTPRHWLILVLLIGTLVLLASMLLQPEHPVEMKVLLAALIGVLATCVTKR